MQCTDKFRLLTVSNGTGIKFLTFSESDIAWYRYLGRYHVWVYFFSNYRDCLTRIKVVVELIAIYPLKALFKGFYCPL